MRANSILKSTAVTTSAMFASGAAFAQPVTYSWTGWYAGLNLGAAFTSLDHTFNIPGTAPRVFSFADGGHHTNFTRGFQLGHNWMFVPRWVVGVEGDINYLSSKRDSSFHSVLVAPAGSSGSEDLVGSQSSRIKWLATIRARFGHVWNDTFFYATGGVAFGGVSSSANALITSRNGDTTRYNGAISDTRSGWAAGGGIEHAFTNRVSAKLEYLHFDLGSVDYPVTGVIVSGGNGFSLNGTGHAAFKGDLVRLGLNVRMGP